MTDISRIKWPSVSSRRTWLLVVLAAAAVMLSIVLRQPEVAACSAGACSYYLEGGIKAAGKCAPSAADITLCQCFRITNESSGAVDMTSGQPQSGCGTNR